MARKQGATTGPGAGRRAIGNRKSVPGPKTSASSGGRPDRIRARQFDADRTDVILTLQEALAARPGERQLLWIDVAGTLAPDEAEGLAERFGLDRRTLAALEAPTGRPHLTIHGKYFHVRVAAEPGNAKDSETNWLDIVADKTNVVISRHADPLDLLDDIDERMEADASVGAFQSATFVALLLDGAVTSYFRAVDAIEDEVDDLDARSLRQDDRHDLLDELVRLRRRIARLRRQLVDHRGVFASLAGAGMTQLIDDPDAAAALLAVGGRFDATVGAVEDSREALIGSFEVYMTRTAQRTNDIMKILAMATVLLLPGSLIAGLLGMNVTVPLPKDDPIVFWYVVLGVVALAALVVGFAKARRWL